MAEAMGVSLKTEQRRSHIAGAGFGPWVRRAEGYRESRQINPSGQVPVTRRRPPSLPLACEVFPDLSAFSVFREIPMAFFYDNFKQLKCYDGLCKSGFSSLLVTCLLSLLSRHS
jgi:hypothetical protein